MSTTPRNTTTRETKTAVVKTRALKLVGLAALTIALCGSQAQCVLGAKPTSAASQSGIEQQWFDRSIRPQDDLYRATNGRWIDKTPIPANRSSIGYRQDAEARSQRLMLEMLEGAAASSAPAGTPMQRLGDFYASYMDEARLAALGKSPLDSTFERINAIHGVDDVAKVLAYLESVDVQTVFSFWISPDRRDTKHHILNFISFGTTVDDATYLDQDAHSVEVRARLSDYVARILELSGDADARRNAQRIVEFERAIAVARSGTAQSSGTAIATRSDNTYSFSEIEAFAPHFNWSAYWAAAGIAGRANAMYIANPNEMASLDSLLARTSIDTIKTYLRYHYATARAQYLNTSFEDAHFAFFAKVLSGQTEPSSRSSRGVKAVTENILDEAGVEYGKRHFTRNQKAYVQAMFSNLKQAYAERIAHASWMEPQTRQHALLKLEKMTAHLGAPDSTSSLIDYSKLVIARDDLFGNVERAQRENYNHRIAQLDRPVDKNQWQVDAFEVSAHYSTGTNQVIMAAGMMQPPFFYPDADDAINYSGLGLVMGHEISHAFDVDGSQRDANGNQRNWWTEADRTQYRTRTRRLEDQFNAYSPLPGYHIDGARTLSENIAESAGLDAAYHAYKISLGKKTPAVIDGLTGEQRFYHGFAQLHRSKMTDAAMIQYIKSDTHSPAPFRVNGTVRNQQGFYDAFGVKPTDKLYLAPDQRFSLW
ncbi:putative endopeptidase [Pararobbsia alpina]|uniref:M13 family metallopeptidase n=1 Tax=Pararobbsia alpina TaxID=621374 RepID=UPI0039A69ABD